MAVYDGKLFAARADSGPQDSTIFRWDGTTWVISGFRYGIVTDLTVYNGELISCGHFTDAIDRWNGTRLAPLGSGLAGTDYIHPEALTVFNGELIVVGDFLTAGGNVSAYWARWAATGVRGDADGDGHLTLADLTDFTNCLNDPVTPDWSATTDPDCLCVHNTDGDGDVDLIDFAAFQRAFGG